MGVFTIGQILQTPKKLSGLKKPPPNAEERNLSSSDHKRMNFPAGFFSIGLILYSFQIAKAPFGFSDI